MSKSAGRETAIDMVLSRPNEEGGGALCNDPSGLCLQSRGNIDASNAGVYTSLARLASQMEGGNGVEAPLIFIETDKAATLVKEYAGHSVVIRVPNKKLAEKDIQTLLVDDSQQPHHGGGDE